MAEDETAARGDHEGAWLSRSRFRRLRVPRIWILGLSSVLWGIPAYLLLRRSLLWMQSADSAVLGMFIPVLVASVAVGYLLWFRKIVARNLQRLRSLPPLVAVWDVVSPRGYAVILVMVTMGLVLRSSDIPRILLAGPYALMGGLLLLGSVRTALEFATDMKRIRRH